MSISSHNLGTSTLDTFVNEICPNRGETEEKLVSFIKTLVTRHPSWRLQEDEIGNIAIHIPSQNSENTSISPVILQAHLDMVQISTMMKDGVDMYDYSTGILTEQSEDGQWIQSQGKITTLGADCGIGIAGALELAKLKKRPPLIIVLTRDEEGDMTGAFHLDPEALGIAKSQAEYMINLDNNFENQILIGSGGGLSMMMEGEYDVFEPKFPQYKVHFSDLKGGHSGEVIDAGRMNIIQEMCNFLILLDENGIPFELGGFQSGRQENSIPKFADITIGVSEDYTEGFFQQLRAFYKQLKKKYPIERSFHYEVEEIERKERLDVMSHQQVMALVKALGNELLGEIIRDEEFGIPKLSNNVGVCDIRNGEMSIQFYARADNPEVMYKLWAYLWNDFFDAGLELRKSQPISPWSPEFTSQFLEVAKRAYKEVNHILPKVVKTHSSLECGILKKNIEHVTGRVLQVISCGPWIVEEHSNTEMLNKRSVDVWMNFLQRLMEILAEEKKYSG